MPSLAISISSAAPPSCSQAKTPLEPDKPLRLVIFSRQVIDMLRFVVSLFCVVAWLAPAQAQNAGAEEQVRRMAAEVTAQVRKNPDIVNSKAQLSALVEQKLMPRFDFNRITQIAMGRNWPKASGAEQNQVVSEFSKLLVRTYSNAIANLRDLDVQVRDSRSNGPSDVTVRTQMVGRAKPVAIDYSLSSGGGGWRVYDVSVEGVSLVTAYRDEFNGVVSSSGVPGLIASLKQKNAK
jgi:phospholipid transport system substrate-binding protein